MNFLHILCLTLSLHTAASAAVPADQKPARTLAVAPTQQMNTAPGSTSSALYKRKLGRLRAPFENAFHL